MSAIVATPESATQRLQVLREELRAARETHGRRSSQGYEAFQRLSREAGALGFPISGLRRHSADEAERFFARTVAGPDGHVYWIGAKDGRFTTNDGRDKIARRWWWEHKHQVTLSRFEEFTTTCGDRACITPDHHTVAQRSRRRFTDEHLIGGLQVWAMRHGRPPTTREWDESGGTPCSTVYKTRFGAWEKAVRAAGFVYRSVRRDADAAECVRSILFLRDRLGHWPNHGEFEASAAVLRAAGLPSSHTTLNKYCGGIVGARRMAGSPE